MGSFRAAEDLLFYLPSVSLRTRIIYWLLLAGICIAITLLPLIKTDISVRSAGVIRPGQERMELRPLVTTMIDSICFGEGEKVVRGSLIMRLCNKDLKARSMLVREELVRCRESIGDLRLLTSGVTIPEFPALRLRSAYYRRDAAVFIAQVREHEAGLAKVRQELAESEQLAADRVISPKELYDKRVELERMSAAYSSFVNQRLGGWQEQLAQYRSEEARFESQRRQLAEERSLYELRAPVTGRLQGLGNRYPGGNVQSGEIIGFLSPEGSMVAECYVAARDIGMIRKGQRVYLQVEAFDYKYFGMLTGRVSYIDPDFTLRESAPLFKVVSSLDSTYLCLKSGLRVDLKKGMTFQSRFVVARRSIWQLLFDKMDDWLNPAAPETSGRF